MKTRLITSASGVLLAASLGTAAEAPKLVPRPIPGLFDALHAEKASNEEALSILNSALANKPLPPASVPITNSSTGSDESEASPASTQAKAYVPEKPADPEAQNRARVLFIYRRATLPPQMTADLAKPDVDKKRGPRTSNQITPVRPGKIRIIPKSEIASLLTPESGSEPAPKPATP